MIALCSMWDYNYHRKGLALIKSLQLHVRDFALCVLALDEWTFSYFEQHRQPGVVAFSLPEIETDELLKVKGQRKWVEYIWTLTPVWTRLCFEFMEVDSLAYIDADCFVFHDLAPLYDEVKGTPVAIIPHRWTPKHADRLRGAGIYNVGWVYFSQAGIKCLDDWRTDCLDWCYWQVEKDGRFADQGYLNDWPAQYGAHVVQHLGANLAPWNQEQYSYSVNGRGLMISNGKRTDPLLFYHFHSFSQDGRRSGYQLNPAIQQHVYKPYEAIWLKL